MKQEPDWKREYPIRRQEERRVTRRQFARFCGCSALALGVAAVGKDRLSALPEGREAMAVAVDGEVAVGGYKLFPYPTPDHPCIMVRLEGEAGYAAFSQSCTHLACPVFFDPAEAQLVCPCHAGFFDAGTGRVLAGPPRRPLPRYAVRVEEGVVMVGPEIINPEQADF